MWHLIMDLVACLDDPGMVQKRLEYIALRHMAAEVTTPDVEVSGLLLRKLN